MSRQSHAPEPPDGSPSIPPPPPLRPVPMIEYRCLWFEIIAGMTVPFSGKPTSNFADVVCERDWKREAHNFHAVMIEAREASKNPWPRWFDNRFSAIKDQGIVKDWA